MELLVVFVRVGAGLMRGGDPCGRPGGGGGGLCQGGGWGEAGELVEGGGDGLVGAGDRGRRQGGRGGQSWEGGGRGGGGGGPLAVALGVEGLAVASEIGYGRPQVECGHFA